MDWLMVLVLVMEPDRMDWLEVPASVYEIERGW